MKDRTEFTKYLIKKENVYELEIEDMLVTIEYSENYKMFNECMVNILKSIKEGER